MERRPTELGTSSARCPDEPGGPAAAAAASGTGGKATPPRQAPRGPSAAAGAADRSAPAAQQAAAASDAAPLLAALDGCPPRVAAEALRLTGTANRQSQALCDFVLENVLVHEAAAQQLQASTADLVRDGQELLALSRQLQPLLGRLAATAAAARELRALAAAVRDAGPPSGGAAQT